jgi:hypothetical protein
MIMCAFDFLMFKGSLKKNNLRKLISNFLHMDEMKYLIIFSEMYNFHL